MNQNESIFRNSIKVDLPETEPIFKNGKDNDIGTRILIGMPEEEPILKTGKDIER